MQLTIKDIMGLKPCYSEEQLVELAAGRESITPAEIAELNISCSDRLWVLIRLMTPAQRDVYTRRVASNVLHLWDAPEVVRRWMETGDPEPRAAAMMACSRAQMASSWAPTAAAEAAAEAAWEAVRLRNSAWDATWAAVYARSASGEGGAAAKEEYLKTAVDLIQCGGSPSKELER